MDVISARRSAHGILNFPRIVMKKVLNQGLIFIIEPLRNGQIYLNRNLKKYLKEMQ